MQTVYLDSDNVVEVSNLRSSITGALISSASVSGQLYAENGTTTIGGSFTLSAVTSPSTISGSYRGTLPAATAALLTAGVFYLLKITITGAFAGVRRIKVLAENHQEFP